MTYNENNKYFIKSHFLSILTIVWFHNFSLYWKSVYLPLIHIIVYYIYNKVNVTMKYSFSVVVFFIIYQQAYLSTSEHYKNSVNEPVVILCRLWFNNWYSLKAGTLTYALCVNWTPLNIRWQFHACLQGAQWFICLYLTNQLDPRLVNVTIHTINE